MTMNTIRLGGTQHRVSRVGFGAMQLSVEERPGREQATAVLLRAVELGISFIDTADIYCLDHTEMGHNERLVARTLREAGVQFGGRGPVGAHYVVVATKGGMTRLQGRLGRDARPERIRAACEASLQALGVNCIDLYQLHAPDPAVPFAESVGALAQLRDEGLIAAVGLSNVGVRQIQLAREITPVSTVQNQYSPWDVTFRKSPVMEYCRSNDITFLPYAPLGGRDRSRLVQQCEALQRIGRRMGCTPAELVLAWMLHTYPTALPIPGARRIDTVESVARSEALSLDNAAISEIRRAFRTLPGTQGLLSWVAGGVQRRVRDLFSARPP
jgi:aryl-alcohol dehydrogenase-like predicted oxidoreductase